MNLRQAKVCNLGALIETPPQNGYSPICPEQATGTWVLGLSALNGRNLDLRHAKPAPTNEPMVERFFLHPGDFLISRSNTLDKVGRVGVFRGGLDNCSYPDLMMRFRPQTKRVNPDYLEAYLKSALVVKYIQQHATGTSGSMKKINQATVASIPVLLPSNQEQKRIVEILDAWDCSIEKTEQLICDKENFCASERTRWICGGGSSGTGIGKIAFEVFERNKACINERVLSVTNSRGFVLPEDQFERRVASADLSNYKIVTRGQYAYNPSRINVGSIARLADWDIGVLSPMYVVFELNHAKVNSDYFLHWLGSHEARERIKNSAQGSVRETVSFTEFSAIAIPLPTLGKQAAIANYFNAMRAEISTLHVYLETLKIQKRGLMQKLLTGQWRVPLSVSAASAVCA